MAAQQNDPTRIGGPYMVQDCDHLSDSERAQNDSQRGARQAQQSQSHNRQQGGDQTGDWHQNDQRRQAQ